MSYPTIVSFFTKNWEYESHSKRLIKECEGLGLDHYIKEMEPTGSWLGNTRLKSTFIKSAMETLDKPILWIDVDGSIFRKPDYLKNIKEDFVARIQRREKRKWHVGTMFFNNTPGGKQLINEWAEECKTCLSSDEQALENIWKRLEHVVTFKDLPENYFEILMNNSSCPSNNCVIAHRLSKDEDKMRMKHRQNNK